MARTPAALPPNVVSRRPAALWRVHAQKYRAAQFHPGGSGNARFSPIYQASGIPIPTLYGASTLEGALMETIFHDVPTPPGDYILDLDKLQEEALVVSRLRLTKNLKFVDLSTKGLKRMGLTRADLIDTPVSLYPKTRARAEEFHLHTKAHGLAWVSKQDDQAKAFVLFGDRIAENAFKIDIDREPLWEGAHLDAALALAECIGIEKANGA